MVFQVPESKATQEKNQFPFQVPGDDTVYRVPLMQYLPGSVVEQIADMEQAGGASSMAAEYLLFGAAGTPAGDAARTLDYEQLQELEREYQKASRIAMGESSASTGS